MKGKGWLKGVVGFCLGGAAGYFGNAVIRKNNEPKIEYVRNDYFAQYFYAYNQWMFIKNHGDSVSNILVCEGFETVAIYGMGLLGCRLLEDLMNDGNKEKHLKVLYGIDRNVQKADYGIRVYGLDCTLPEVDVVIVTPLFDYDNISRELKKVLDDKTRIVSFEDVVFNNL